MKKVNTNLVVALLVIVGLLGYALLVQASNLEPSAAPAPTMKTLQEVYDAASGGINEREGFCQYLEVPADSNDVVLTVPAGKRFVLLKLHRTAGSHGADWNLTVDDTLFINGRHITQAGYDSGNYTGSIYRYMYDFPDRCVVVHAAQTLKVVNNEGSTFNITLIGYYYNVQ